MHTRNSFKRHLRYGEIALLFALAATLVWGAVTERRQEDLAEKTVRLHVIAHSNGAEDQAQKLLVRDRVLEMAEELLRSSRDAAQAREALRCALPELQQAAQETLKSAGCDHAVHTYLECTAFPRKSYEGFALPAGEYTALRVVIGDGGGANWWCVVFPPLCNNAAIDLREAAVSAGWGSPEVSLVTQENESYALRFRCIELWETLRLWLGKK